MIYKKLLVLCCLMFCLVSTSVQLKAEVIAVGESFRLQSQVLKQQRRYSVSLPSRYQAEPQRRYPVLYLVDADFQFFHVAATVKNLTQMGKIPPLIVVGVATEGPDDYVKATTWSIQGEEAQTNGGAYGGIEPMRLFLNTELIPQIEKTYRTSSERMLAGYSLGGLYSLYELIQKDSPFQAYLAMSASLWFDDYSFQKKFEDFLTEKNSSKRLFLSLANERGMGVTELVAALQKANNPQLRWNYRQFPDETHYSTALPALYAGLSYLYADYFTDTAQMRELKGADAVFKLFAQKQQQQFGSYQIDWLQAYTLGKFFVGTEQVDEMPKFLALLKQHQPASLNEVSIQFAKMYNKLKQPQQALELLAQADLTHSADGLKQKSDTLKALGHTEQAARLLTQAQQLAKQQQLDMWEQMELR
jgi:predicted alpha/beta superfamily hydrolase